MKLIINSYERNVVGMDILTPAIFAKMKAVTKDVNGNEYEIEISGFEDKFPITLEDLHDMFNKTLNVEIEINFKVIRNND